MDFATARTPPRDCLSPLQRSGTLSRPHGPRQLGSKSPILSPRPLPPGPSRTPSDDDNDEDNPLVQNGLRSSTGRKRFYDDEGADDSSTSSKRALRAVAAGQYDSPRMSAKPRGSDPKSRGKATDRKEQGRSAAVARSAAGKDYTTDLQRTGSLPRSPHTRSLYQQSRPTGVEDTTPTRLPSSAVKGPSSTRIPRKPAPTNGDIEMELSLVRKQSIAERATVSTLRYYRAARSVADYAECRSMQPKGLPTRRRLSTSDSSCERAKKKPLSSRRNWTPLKLITRNTFQTSKLCVTRTAIKMRA